MERREEGEDDDQLYAQAHEGGGTYQQHSTPIPAHTGTVSRIPPQLLFSSTMIACFSNPNPVVFGMSAQRLDSKLRLNRYGGRRSQKKKEADGMQRWEAPRCVLL